MQDASVITFAAPNTSVGGIHNRHNSSIEIVSSIGKITPSMDNYDYPPLPK